MLGEGAICAYELVELGVFALVTPPGFSELESERTQAFFTTTCEHDVGTHLRSEEGCLNILKACYVEDSFGPFVLKAFTSPLTWISAFLLPCFPAFSASFCVWRRVIFALRSVASLLVLTWPSFSHFSNASSHPPQFYIYTLRLFLKKKSN